MDNDAVSEFEKAGKVPKLVAGVELTSLPLGAAGGFVLSRIDGVASVAELAESTGVATAEVRRTLGILADADALEWVEQPEHGGRRRPKQGPAPGRRSAESIRTMPVPPGTPRRLYDPQELEEPNVALDVETRRLILDTYYRLSASTLYQVLGVATDAPKAEIRSAYFKLSKVFHPDTQFGKELGSYKAKMEAVFKRLTEAYEILGKKKLRAEYDDYLQIKKATHQAEESVERAEREAERVKRDSELSTSEAQGAGIGPADGRPSTRPPTTHPGPPERPLATPKPATAGDAPKQAAPTQGGRREVLPENTAPRAMSAAAQARAKKLMAKKLAAAAGRRPSRSRTSVPPQDQAPMERDQVFRGLAGSLKQASMHTGGIDRSSFQLDQALEAEKSGNLLAAVNALRLALAFSEERPDVLAEYDRVRGLYAAEMADTFEKQARYEAKMGQWTEAALSWSKVCEGRPDDGNAHVQAAVALLEADGDLSQAKKFAELGRSLVGDAPVAHRALGRIYYALDMKVNAKRAFEVVLKHDPSDQEIRKLIKEL